MKKILILIFVFVSFISVAFTGCNNEYYFYFSQDVIFATTGDSFDIFNLDYTTNLSKLDNYYLNSTNEDLISIDNSLLSIKKSGIVKIEIVFNVEGKVVKDNFILNIKENETESIKANLEIKDNIAVVKIFKFNQNYDNFSYEILSNKDEIICSKIGNCLNVFLLNKQDIVKIKFIDIYNKNSITIQFNESGIIQ